MPHPVPLLLFRGGVGIFSFFSSILSSRKHEETSFGTENSRAVLQKIFVLTTFFIGAM